MGIWDGLIVGIVIFGALSFFVLRSINNNKRKKKGCCADAGPACANCGHA